MDAAPDAAGSTPRSASLPGPARRALGGVLELVDDPEVRDILLQSHDGQGELWVDRGGSLARIVDWSVPEEQLRAVAIALIAAGGRHLDELHPCADVRLGDAIRVHAVLPPVSAGGTVVSIRLPGTRVRSLQELIAAGLCSRGTATRLHQLVTGRKNILVTGGTGSGKTTLLSALLELVPATERMISIEDVAELRPRHPHHIALEARQANIEGSGEVTLDQLLREALRMRPDRVILGECRGPEIATLLAALNTGHEGGGGTLHANGIDEVAARLESLGMLAGLEPAALARQVVSAFHCVIHLERRSGTHRMSAIGVPGLTAAGMLQVTELSA